MMRRTALIAAALLVSPAAQADFFTYQKWSALSEASRAAYSAGAYDAGMPGYDSTLTSLTHEENETYVWHYGQCLQTAQMTNIQLASNVWNFARDKPALQTGSVHIALLSYLQAACPTKKAHL
jgi:hypothetical protein